MASIIHVDDPQPLPVVDLNAQVARIPRWEKARTPKVVPEKSSNQIVVKVDLPIIVPFGQKETVPIALPHRVSARAHHAA